MLSFYIKSMFYRFNGLLFSFNSRCFVFLTLTKKQKNMSLRAAMMNLAPKKSLCKHKEQQRNRDTV